MRTFHRIAVCLLALLLTGCGGGGRERVTIRFWNGFTGPDGRTMLRLVKRFNQENPDVHVIMQRMDWATYYNKLFVAGIGHRAPEVFVVHTPSLERFVRAGFLRPVDDHMSGPNGIPVSDLDPNVWEGTLFDGSHYAVPLDVYPMGMYYNKRLFREAGLVDASGEARPPKNRAEFLDALRRLTRKSNGRTPDQWGFVFTNLQSNTYAMMRQFGGEFFTPDNTRCIMNNPENVAALQFCVDMIREQRVAPPPENFDAWIGFRQGRVGTAWEGIYMLADLQKQEDLDFAGAPIPQIGPRPATWAGSHNLCLRGDLEGRTLDGAWRFVRFLSDNSLDWAEGGQVPIRRSLRNTERFRSMPVQAAFARQIPYAVYMPRLTYFFEFETEFNQAVEAALRASVTPQQALDTATSNVNRIIERQRATAAAGGGSS